MLIECILHRVNGTHANIGGKDYHFVPRLDAEGKERHVCNVEDDEHLSRFLSIREGYRHYREVAPGRPAPARGLSPSLSELAERALKGESGAVVEGYQIPLTPTLTLEQLRETQAKIAAAIAQAEADANLPPAASLQQPPPPAGANTDLYSEMSDEQLRELVTERTGERPHFNTGRAKLISLLQE